MELPSSTNPSVAFTSDISSSTSASTRETVLYYGGKRIPKSQTLNGNNTTVTTNIFKVTGVCKCKLRGKVKTQLGANVTGVFFDIYDGTASTPITSNGGVDISAAPVGSLIIKDAAAASALTFFSSATQFLEETLDKEFIVGAKNGVDTFIRMTYATTDTPTSGAIDWNLIFIPNDDNSKVEAAS